MASPSNKSPGEPSFSASEISLGQQAIDSPGPEESTLSAQSDRLYQIAALAAGIILLATVF